MSFRTIPEPFHCTLSNIRFELNLAYYVKKSYLKKAIGVHTSNLAANPI